MRKKGKRTMWQSPPLINTSPVLNKIIAFYKKCLIQPYHSGKLKFLYEKTVRNGTVVVTTVSVLENFFSSPEWNWGR